LVVYGDGTIAVSGSVISPHTISVTDDDITITNGILITSSAVFKQRLSITGGITIPFGHMYVTGGLSVYDEGVRIAGVSPVSGASSSNQVTISSLAVTSGLVHHLEYENKSIIIF